jgi:hypothetical protein
MPMLIGTGPNQVPTNSMLGDLAYQTKKAPRFDTMPVVGGSPIVERGSNANGTYIRFAGGTQICTHRFLFAANGTNAWTYPAAFAGTVSPEVFGTSRNLIAFVRAGYGGPLVCTNMQCSDIGGNAVVAEVSLIAVGVWEE